jgi:hypothetical protein
MARPGIMLYFDILEPIKVLPDADKGRLLVAMLEYGKSGTVPEFTGMLALAWGFVQPSIDRDSEAYNRTILKRQYASFCREQKRKGEPELTFDEWLIASDNGIYQVTSSDTKWHPTTTSSSTGTPSSTSNSTPKSNSSSLSISAAAVAPNPDTSEPDFATAAADRNRNIDIVGGDLGKGVIALSSAQVGDLLDQMGLDAFNYYVDKLSSFIIKNDAKVKNHYETILKWWKEDGNLHGQG